MKTLLSALTLLLLASTADAQCIKKAPYARYAERVLLSQPCGHERVELLIRNSDSCTCPQTCFTLSPGWRTPVVDATRPPMRITRTRLETREGAFHPPYVCLKPGQEATVFQTFDIACEQDGSGHMIATTFLTRHDTNDYYIKHFDAEGTVIAALMSYEDARALVYSPAPPDGAL